MTELPMTITYGHADLTKYNAARRALAEAVRIDEVKDIRDKAAAMRLYAMQARDRVLIDQATEIRLRAERRAGELLKDMANNGERHRRGDSNQHAKSQTATLQNLDINKSQSSRWQKLAETPDDDFEELVAGAKQKACSAVDRAQQPKPKPPQPKPKPEQKAGRKHADVAAACIAEIAVLVRIAIPKIGAKERSAFLDDLRKTVRAIVAEATARDVDTDQWEETTH
jgi:hypothetical protein